MNEMTSRKALQIHLI